MKISISLLKFKAATLWHAFLLLMALSPCSFGGSLTLYAEHYPPYTIDANKEGALTPLTMPSPDTKGKHAGLDIELIRHAYAAMGVDINFKFSPWKRVMRNVEMGSVLGGISCRKTKPRAVFSNFSTPVSQSRLAFITRSNYEGKPLQDIDALSSLNVVIVSGYSQQSMLESRSVKYTSASSVTQALNLVRHRDQDVFFSGWEGAAYEAKRLGYIKELEFTGLMAGAVKTYHVCFSKKFAESDKWRIVLNEGLEKISNDGLMTAIKKKYGIYEK